MNVKTGHFIGISLILLLFSPTCVPIIYIGAPVCAILFFSLTYNREGVCKNKNYLSVVLAALIFISLVLNFFANDVSIKAAFRDFLLIVAFASFPCIRDEKVPIGYIYTALAALMLSQLVYILNLSMIFNYIDALWPNEDMIYSGERIAGLADTGGLFGARVGGIFRNPNQFGRAITFVFILFLLEGEHLKSWKKVFWGMLTLFSVLWTGSRTALTVYVATIAFYSVLKKENISSKKILYFAMGGCIVVAILLFAQLYSIRSINFSEGLEYSLGEKFSVLHQYLSTLNAGELLFGRADSSAFGQANLALGLPDSEYGELIVNFGALFFVVFLFFYGRLFFGASRGNKLFFVITLWMLTSALIMNFRMSIIFFIFLSKYTSKQSNGNKVIQFGSRQGKNSIISQG